MTDPVTLMAIGMGATIAGGGIKAFGDISGAQASSRMYQYQAGVANALAKVATTNANWDIASGETKAQAAGLAGRATVGRETVRGGAGNVSLGPGSSTAAVVSSARSIAGENEAVLRADAAHAAYGEQIQSAAKTAEAGADIVSGKNAITAGYIGAAGDIVSSVGQATSVASKWYTTTGPGATPPQYDDPSGQGYGTPGYIG